MGRMTVAPAFQGARLAWAICRYEAGNSSTRLGGGSASVTPGADTITAVCVRNRLTRGNVRAVFSVGTGRGVRVKVNKLVAPVGVAAIAIGMAAATVVPASAANNIKPFGVQETLNDYVTGAPMIGYTVTGLSPSSDAVPHNGQLYAATVKVEGLGGWATPLVPLFNARARSGQNYRIIGGGVDPAPPGGTTTGKLYFDVVGDTPNSVVYSDGVQDLLVWVAVNGMGEGSGAPDSAGETTEIIGEPPTDGGGEAASAPAAPEVIPAPEEVNPFETPEQHEAHEGGR